MKWDRENKERLYGLIYQRFQTMKSHPIITGRHLRDTFLHEFGIEKIQMGKNRSSRFMPNRRDRVIIHDPWRHQSHPKLYSKGCVEGISIPKDIAEKFLVLGVP